MLCMTSSRLGWAERVRSRANGTESTRCRLATGTAFVDVLLAVLGAQPEKPADIQGSPHHGPDRRGNRSEGDEPWRGSLRSKARTPDFKIRRARCAGRRDSEGRASTIFAVLGDPGCFPLSSCGVERSFPFSETLHSTPNKPLLCHSRRSSTHKLSRARGSTSEG